MKGTGGSRNSGHTWYAWSLSASAITWESLLFGQQVVWLQRDHTLVSNYVGLLALLESRITVRLANKMSPTKVLGNSFSTKQPFLILLSVLSYRKHTSKQRTLPPKQHCTAVKQIPESKAHYRGLLWKEEQSRHSPRELISLPMQRKLMRFLQRWNVDPIIPSVSLGRSQRKMKAISCTR